MRSRYWIFKLKSHLTFTTKDAKWANILFHENSFKDLNKRNETFPDKWGYYSWPKVGEYEWNPIEIFTLSR